MSLFELVVISISLAMDAFTVSMMYGISMPKGNIKKQSFIAFYFGFFQALMPFLGYHLGCVFSKKIQSYDHYIAFIFLMIGFRVGFIIAPRPGFRQSPGIQSSAVKRPVNRPLHRAVFIFY